MTRTRRLKWAGLLCVLALGMPAFAAPAPAPESPLAVVPADAPIVVQVRGIDGTKKRLFDMVKNAVPDLAPKVLPQLEDKLKEALMGRQLKGLAPDGPDFLVLNALPPYGKDKQPPVALLLKVTRYDDFIDGILTDDERKALKKDAAGYEVTSIGGRDVCFLHRDDYAVITPDPDTATLFTKKQPGLDGRLSKEVAKKLLESDVAAYVDMQVVNKQYGGQIKDFRRLFEFFLDQAANQQGQFDKGTMDVVKQFYGGLFQLAEDSQTYVWAITFRPEGLALSSQFRVGEATPSGTFLKDMKPADLGEASKLPAGQMAYYGMKAEPSMMAVVQSWMHGILPGADGKEDKAVKAAFDLLAEAAPQTWLADFDMPVQGLQVGHFKDPAKAVAGQLQLYQALKAGTSFQSVILKGKPDVTANAQDHRGFKLNAVSLQWDFTKIAENAKGGKELAEAMRKMMGDGVKSWFGTDGKVYVQVTAKDWDAAKNILDEFLDGKNTVGQNEAFQEARKQLPEQATVLALVDVPRYTAMIVEFMEASFKARGAPFPAAVGKGEKGKSYLGAAVVLQPGHCSFDLWIPGSAAGQVRKMVEPIIKGAGPGKGIQP